VAQVTVNGLPAALTGDTFTCSVPVGTTELVIETKNADGQVIGLTRTIQISP
jgi:uncharacterized Zn-binding protein involved in type VI secretion